MLSPRGSVSTETHAGLVGRDDELGLLDGLLDSVEGGTPRFVTISGEPGIGKTSLGLELLRRVAGRGHLTLQGRAAELESEVPFSVVADAVDDLSALLGTSSAVGTAQERFKVHTAVGELLERLARPNPLCLFLDDLQWADREARATRKASEPRGRKAFRIFQPVPRPGLVAPRIAD
jgi:predicted ATPase